jgi:hypothetical protein
MHTDFIDKSSQNWISTDLHTFNQMSQHLSPPIVWHSKQNNILDSAFGSKMYVDQHPTPYIHWCWAKTYLQEFIKNSNDLEQIASSIEQQLRQISVTEKYISNYSFGVSRQITRI